MLNYLNLYWEKNKFGTLDLCDEVKDEVIIDYGTEGKIVSMETLDASDQISEHLIRNSLFDIFQSRILNSLLNNA